MVQMTDDSGFDKSGNNRDREKKTDFGCILRLR